MYGSVLELLSHGVFKAVVMNSGGFRVSVVNLSVGFAGPRELSGVSSRAMEQKRGFIS